jgi:hypothetical protein
LKCGRTVILLAGWHSGPEVVGPLWRIQPWLGGRVTSNGADPWGDGPRALREQARHWATLWGVPDLADSVTVEFSTRMRVSLGLCRPAQNRIRLSSVLLEGDSADPTAAHPPDEGGAPSFSRASLLEEVLCHELAHVAVQRLHGRRAKPHGPEWKALMRKAGFEPRVRLLENDPRLPAAFNRPRPRWEHRCPVCGVKQLAGRPVRQWRCIRCRKAGRSGRLEIRKILPEEKRANG